MTLYPGRHCKYFCRKLNLKDMRQRLIVILILLLWCLNLGAQAPSIILKGKLVEKGTGMPDSYATIRFYSNIQKKNVAYNVAAEDGTFEQKINSIGQHTLIYENVGRKQLSIPFEILEGMDVYDFGIIEVENDVEALKGAVVVSQKELVKMEVDRMTYKVEDDVDAQTSSVLEMLRKVPMVTVDGQDNITVNGNSSFQVYIDGKPNQLMTANPSQAFKGMAASSVKSIEVITNPGVKYDAEGVGGVLNITTMAGSSDTITKAQERYFGNLTTNIATRGPMGSGSFNMQKNKWSFGVNANAMYMKNKGLRTETERVQMTQSGNISTSNLAEMTLVVPSYMLNANLNYLLSENDIISITGGISHFGMDTDGTINTAIVLPNNVTGHYDGTSTVHGWKRSISASADYQHTFNGNPKKIFVLSYQFSSMPVINNTINTFSNSSIEGMDLTDRKSDGYSNSISHIFQADFSTPMGRVGTFGVGAKFQLRNNLSQQKDYIQSNGGFVVNEDGSLDYSAGNKIAAAYAEYSLRAGKIGLNAGMRYEHTWVDMKYKDISDRDFVKDYGNLVPAASLQWSINEKNNIGLSYNMRISRPGITYLNPYIDKTDPTTLKYGNYELKTEETHNTSVVYNLSLRKLSLNLTLRHSITPEGISSYSFFDDNNLMHTTYGNIVRNNTVGLNTFVMYSPWNKTRIMINGGIDHADLKSKELNASKKGWLYTATIGVQQTLPLDIRLSVNFISLSNGIGIQSTHSGTNMLTLGLTRSFLGDKLALSASVVGTANGGIYMKRNYITEGIDFKNVVIERIPMGTATLGITWNFGGASRTSLKKAQRKTIEDNQLNTTTIGESMSQMMMH